jgi:hypothetical protein
MIGLVPMIHVLTSLFRNKDVDGRVIWREDALCAFARHDE